MGNDANVDHVEGLWRNAWAYDLEDGQYAADVPYWAALVERLRPARILELGCGTGRITMPIAEAGLRANPDLRIVALDYSPALLECAREKLAAADPAIAGVVTYVEGDMRSLAFDESFDLVVCGFNSFAYLHTIGDQLACLRAVHDHLAPEGRFAIDLVVPHLDFLAEAQQPTPIVRMDVDEKDPEPGLARLRRTYADSYDFASQTLTTAFTHEAYFADGRQMRWVDDLTWHMFFPAELELLLRDGGLTIEVRYGDYRQTPWGPRSRLYLWVMKAAERAATP